MKIKLNKIISFLMIMGFSCAGMAQMETQFTQYMFNRLSFNPGYAGSSGSICSSVMYRNQWLGLNLDSPAPGIDAGSTPTDYLFTFDSPVKVLHGGLGFTVFQDKLGYNDAFYASLDYAFRIYWGPGNLAAGAEVNFFNSTLQYQNLIGSDDFTGNYLDPVQSAGDPMLSGTKASDFLIDASTGLYYQVPGSYWLSASVKNLLASKSNVLHRKNARLLMLGGGYSYYIPANPSFQLRPSALFKMASLKTMQLDLSCLLAYENLVWGGVSYRFQDAIAFMAGVNWQNLNLGVSYDMTTSQLGGYKEGLSNGTLEVYLRYCFKVIIPPKMPTVGANTRFVDW